MNSGYPGRLVHCWLATIPQVGKPHTEWNIKETLSNESSYRLPMGLLYTGIATSGSYSDCRTLLPGGKVRLVLSGSSHSFGALLATIHLLSKPACLAMSLFTRYTISGRGIMLPTASSVALSSSSSGVAITHVGSLYRSLIWLAPEQKSVFCSKSSGIGICTLTCYKSFEMCVLATL